MKKKKNQRAEKSINNSTVIYGHERRAWEPQDSCRQGRLLSEAAAHRTIPRPPLPAVLPLGYNLRTGADSGGLGVRAKLSEGKSSALHGHMESSSSLVYN